MATNKRKQDEKHLKMLREMVALPSNKTCFDCHQRGPTYVNMTIGSFVCTSCSGILRGLNPPHRVKSISMASFTPEEMDFLKMHGNELNRKVFLGLYDNRTWPEPDSRDEQRVRDFMVQKYENKRFYVAPTDAMREEAKRMNEAALSKQPQVKPLRSLLGENATKLVVNSQPSQVSHNSTPAPVTAPAMAAVPKPTVPAAVPAQQPAKASSGFDLLGDLGSDPFASSAPAPPAASTGGFADFSSFGAAPSAPPAQPAQSSAPATFPISSAPLQPFSNTGGLQPLSATPLNAAPPTSTPASSAPTNFSAISDKYAALADLDSTFSTTTAAPTQQTVNWGGSDSTVGSTINWGGSTPGSTGSGDTGGSINWGGSSGGGSGGLGWNSNAGGVPGGPSAVGGGVFGATSTAANPFGGGGGGAPPAMSQAAGMPGQANPFGAGGAPPAFGQAPASTPSSFGYQQQFPVQNGGFGMASTAAGFAYSSAPATYGVAPQGFQAQPGMAQGFGMPAAQGFGPPAGPPPAYGAQQGFGAGWGQMPGGAQQPSANPFMSAANQQHVAPRGTSTNPFL